MPNAAPLEESRIAWLGSVSYTVAALASQWSLTTVGVPFQLPDEGNAWVAPVTDAYGADAVLKLSFPHFEEEHEIAGLRFWDGDATVRLLQSDERRHALLLERCTPGTSLRELPEPEQDIVIAGLLRRLWRSPPAEQPFRPLEAMLTYWIAEAEADLARSSDAGLVREGIKLFESLPRSASRRVLLATDLHAGNVLRSSREPWLVIDPKPFLGDPAYDATQHLLNCPDRLLGQPAATIERFADLLEVDAERVRLWTFARAAVASATHGGETSRWQLIADALRRPCSPLLRPKS